MLFYIPFFTFEYIIFQSYWCFNGGITIKMKRRNMQASTDRSSQVVVNLSEVGGPTLANFRFHNHSVVTALYPVSLACYLSVNVEYLVPSL